MLINNKERIKFNRFALSLDVEYWLQWSGLGAVGTRSTLKRIYLYVLLSEFHRNFTVSSQARAKRLGKNME